MKFKKLNIHDHPLMKKCVTETPLGPKIGGIRKPGRKSTMKKVNTNRTHRVYTLNTIDRTRLNYFRIIPARS